MTPYLNKVYYARTVTKYTVSLITAKYNLKIKSRRLISHAQLILLLSCVTYLLFSSHAHASFNFQSYVYKLMMECEVCNV